MAREPSRSFDNLLSGKQLVLLNRLLSTEWNIDLIFQVLKCQLDLAFLSLNFLNGSCIRNIIFLLRYGPH
jgi:hypothetical protein